MSILFKELEEQTSRIKAKEKVSLATHIKDGIEIWVRYYNECELFLKKYWQKFLSDIWSYEQLMEAIVFTIYFHDIGKATKEFQTTLQEKDRSYHPLYSLYILSVTDAFQFRKISIPLLAICGHHTPIYFDDKGYLYKELINKPPEFLSGYEIFFQYYPKIFKEVMKRKPVYSPIPQEITPMNVREFFISTNLIINNLGKKKNKQILKLYVILSGAVIFADRIASMMEFGEKDITFFWKDKNLRTHLEDSIKGFSGWKRFQIEASDSNSSLFIEIPTGEGKTEAALLWAENNIDSLFSRLVYTLPTRITSNKMYDRLKDSLEDTPVAIVHGGGKVKLDDEFPDEEDEQKLALTYAIHKTFNYPVTVSTLDAYLLPYLHFGRWDLSQFNLTNSLTIIDEVHCYEPRMIGFLIRVLELQQELGNKFILMSASLPDVIKRRFQERLKFQYVGGTEKHEALFKKSPGEIIKVNTSVFDATEQIISSLNSGMKILVVFNTVRDVRKFYNQLIKSIPKEKVVLYHSEFTKIDRQYKENEIYYRLGKSKTLDGKVLVENEVKSLNELVISYGKPFILIATQVVEVSLDIDFDILFTELAPIDALIQRIGRVNRKKDPARKTKLYLFKKLNTGEKRWNYPYPKELLDKTWESVQNGRFTLYDSSLWLNMVYSEEVTFQNTWYKEEFEKGYALLDKVLDTTKGISQLRYSNEFIEEFVLRNSDKKLKHIQVIPETVKSAFLSYNSDFNEWYRFTVDVYLYKIYQKEIPIRDDKYFSILGVDYDYQSGILWDGTMCFL